MPRSGTFRAFKNSPLNKDVWFALIPLILPILGKGKSPNFFEIQGFTSFCLLKKWCHQESNKFDKWLYFFEFILCKRPNLPLLLHRFSAMLCFFFVGDILICAQR